MWALEAQAIAVLAYSGVTTVIILQLKGMPYYTQQVKL